MAKNFNTLRDGLAQRVGEEKLAENHRRVEAEYQRDRKRLKDLRKARNLTQAALAERLDSTQAQISRLEGQTDLYMSTLADYVHAMGGELVIEARFDGDESIPLTIAELEEPVGA